MAVCIQLSHAGRKASCAVPCQGDVLLSAAQGGWPALAPSALAHAPQEPPPQPLSLAEMDKITQDFAAAARRAHDLGIEAIELHGAHGYLLHQFLSPLANQRDDAYGSSVDNRIRFPLAVFDAVRKVVSGTLGMRLSGTDWVDGGWTVEETAELAQRLKLASTQ